MTMSDEVRAEYHEMMSRVVWKCGSVVSETADIFGWVDYEATKHIRRCEMASRGVPVEDSWYEFAGTFTDDLYRYGVTIPDVTCACGQVRKRSVRVADYQVSSFIEAVFAEMYAAYRQT